METINEARTIRDWSDLSEDEKLNIVPQIQTSCEQWISGAQSNISQTIKQLNNLESPINSIQADAAVCIVILASILGKSDIQQNIISVADDIMFKDVFLQMDGLFQVLSALKDNDRDIQALQEIAEKIIVEESKPKEQLSAEQLAKAIQEKEDERRLDKLNRRKQHGNTSSSINMTYSDPNKQLIKVKPQTNGAWEDIEVTNPHSKKNLSFARRTEAWLRHELYLYPSEWSEHSFPLSMYQDGTIEAAIRKNGHVPTDTCVLEIELPDKMHRYFCYDGHKFEDGKAVIKVANSIKSYAPDTGKNTDHWVSIWWKNPIEAIQWLNMASADQSHLKYRYNLKDLRFKLVCNPWTRTDFLNKIVGNQLQSIDTPFGTALAGIIDPWKKTLIN